MLQETTSLGSDSRGRTKLRNPTLQSHKQNIHPDIVVANIARTRKHDDKLTRDLHNLHTHPQRRRLELRQTALQRLGAVVVDADVEDDLEFFDGGPEAEVGVAVCVDVPDDVDSFVVHQDEGLGGIDLGWGRGAGCRVASDVMHVGAAYAR